MTPTTRTRANPLAAKAGVSGTRTPSPRVTASLNSRIHLSAGSVAGLPPPGDGLSVSPSAISAPAWRVTLFSSSYAQTMKRSGKSAVVAAVVQSDVLVPLVAAPGDAIHAARRGPNWAASAVQPWRSGWRENCSAPPTRPRSARARSCRRECRRDRCAPTAAGSRRGLSEPGLDTDRKEGDRDLAARRHGEPGIRRDGAIGHARLPQERGRQERDHASVDDR